MYRTSEYVRLTCEHLLKLIKIGENRKKVQNSDFAILKNSNYYKLDLRRLRESKSTPLKEPETPHSPVVLFSR